MNVYDISVIIEHILSVTFNDYTHGVISYLM